MEGNLSPPVLLRSGAGVKERNGARGRWRDGIPGMCCPGQGQAQRLRAARDHSQEGSANREICLSSDNIGLGFGEQSVRCEGKKGTDLLGER